MKHYTTEQFDALLHNIVAIPATAKRLERDAWPREMLHEVYESEKSLAIVENMIELGTRNDRRIA